MTQLVQDCFTYGIFKDKPSKSHKKWFADAFDCPYPTDYDNLSKSLQKDLRHVVKLRRDAAKHEEKMAAQRAKRGFADEDVWNIDSWFMRLMPQMLQQFKDNLHGCPALSITMPSHRVVLDEKDGDKDLERWKAIIDEMIMLCRDMNEETCSMKNPYEDEYMAMSEDFRSKYGFFGEELKSEEEKTEEKQKGSSRAYFPTDFPELYPDAEKLTHKYLQYETAIAAYRIRCKERFFHLFSEYFYDLWD